MSKLIEEQKIRVQEALDIEEFIGLALRIANGEDISDLSHLALLEEDEKSFSKDGYNLIHYAAVLNNTKALNHLLENGFDIEAKDKHRGATAIILAAETNSLGTLNLLIEHEANVNVKQLMDFTALILASKYGYDECVKALIKAGANLNDALELLGSRGDNALIRACSYNHITCAKMLINAGANVNQSGAVDYTPIMVTNNLELLEALVKAGADVNARDNIGDTALIRCTYVDRYNKDIKALLSKVKLLLENGADINITDEKGKTAFDLVLQKNNYIAASMIYEKLSDEQKAQVHDNTLLKLVAFQKKHPELKLETIASLCRYNMFFINETLQVIENHQSTIVFMQNLLNPYDFLELEDIRGFGEKYLVARNLNAELKKDLKTGKKLEETFIIPSDIMGKILEQNLPPKFKSGFFTAILQMSALKRKEDVSSEELSNLKPDASECKDKGKERDNPI